MWHLLRHVLSFQISLNAEKWLVKSKGIACAAKDKEMDSVHAEIFAF